MVKKFYKYLPVAIVAIIFGAAQCRLSERFSWSITAIVMAISAIVFFAAIVIAYKFLQNHKFKMKQAQIQTKWQICIFALFFCAYLALFIFWFPGTSDNDAIDMFTMLSGADPYGPAFRYHGLNAHHTLGYCLFYFIFYQIPYMLTENFTLSVGVACFVQICIVSFCLTRATCQIYRTTAKRWLLIVCMVFFVVNPLVLEMTITHWKDAMFCPILFLVVAELFAYNACEGALKNKSNCIIFAVALIAISILRSNGILITFGVLVYLFVTDKALRKYCLKVFAALVIIEIALFASKAIFKVQSAHFSESISIPLQQVCHTACETDGTDPEFTNFFNNIISTETIKTKYNYQTPDNIKFEVSFNDDYLDSHKIEFVQNWITLGLKYPVSYIKAWALQTRYLWSFPNMATYPFVPGNDYLHANPTNAQVGLAQFFAHFLKWYNPFYNAGVMFWSVVVCVILTALLKRKNFIVLLPLVLLLATLFLAVPAYDFRYVYAIHLSLPNLFSLVWFAPDKKLANKQTS